MDFSSREEFEVHVHKCFGHIFEQLMKIDSVVKEGAEKEEQEHVQGAFTELRDDVEDVILHCHLAWQYHRLSRMTGGSTWGRLQKDANDGEQTSESDSV